MVRPVNFPTQAEVADLILISTPQMAHLLGISRHALQVRVQRRSSTVPAPHVRLAGCLVWIVTKELVELVGVDDPKQIPAP
jgi:predicted DNA-binding transcriptional regulator AlpA